MKSLFATSLFATSLFFATGLSILHAPNTNQANAQSNTIQQIRYENNPVAEQWIVAARDAFRNNQRDVLEKAIDQVKGHPLQDYPRYWLFKLRLSDPTPPSSEEIQRFLQQQDGSMIGELFRRDWLILLAKQKNWQTFDREWAQLVLKSDERDLQCYALLSASLKGDSIYSEAREILRQGKENGQGCTELMQHLAQKGLLTTQDVWDRVRNTLNANLPAASKNAGAWLDTTNYPSQNMIEVALGNPLSYLKLYSGKWQQASATAGAELALLRLARKSYAQAAQNFTSELQQAMPAERRAFVWGTIAMYAAKDLDEQAYTWYEKSGSYTLGEEAMEWKVRSALRLERWEMVASTILAMPATQQEDPTWVYWLGRAYKTQGKHEQANQLFQKIANQHHFYGNLALEELGQKIVAPSRTMIREDEVANASGNPGLLRALYFYRVNLRFEGNREWNFSLRKMNDTQLLGAAEFAFRQQVYDRAINSADRTLSQHDFNLRYPSPMRELLKPRAAEIGLDESWAYGLIRQESRFVMNARSNVGASGLMQIMPATAKMVARKIGLNAFDLNHPEVNITLGTHYLKDMQNNLDGSYVQATAAYNAGPGRPMKWRSRFHLGKPMEGAIFAESIPFNETRDYVKRVLSNTVYYAALFEGKPQSIKARLGNIQVR